MKFFQVPRQLAPTLADGLEVENIPSFKIVLLGDGNIGKTSFVRKLVQQRLLQPKSIPAMGVTIHPIIFETNRGPIRMNIWDTAGQEKLGGDLCNGFYVQAHGAVVLFDVTSLESFNRVTFWQKNIMQVIENIPVIVAGNRIDSPDLKVRPNKSFQMLSIKANYNIVQVFLCLARKLVADSSLHFSTMPTLLPPEISIDPQRISRLENEWGSAN